MKRKGKQAQRKSFLAVLLCFCMIATMLPAGSVKAEEAESGSDDSEVTFEALEGTEGISDSDYDHLLDGDTKSLWAARLNNGEIYIIWKASETLEVTGYSITTGTYAERYQNGNPKSWTLYGAKKRLTKDAKEWNELDRITNDTVLEAKNTTTFNYGLNKTPSDKYDYFMLKVDGLVGDEGESMVLGEFTLKYTVCDHKWEATDQTIAPDCTKPGKIVYRCSECQAEKKMEDPSNPALGHQLVGGRCNRCGDVGKKRPRGEGTQESPYLIGEASELYWFAGLVNGDKDVCTGGVVKDQKACAELTADITINERVLDADGNLISCTEGLLEWTPIDWNGKNPWSGKFDGQGHCIRGLYCDDSQLQYVGLFGCISGGEITGVGVEDAYMTGDNVGGICGCFSWGIMDNCYAVGTMSGQNAGGLIGYTGGSQAKISNSYCIAQMAGSHAGLSPTGHDYYQRGWTNCYYGSDDNGETYADYQSAEEFAGGKVAYLLQKSCAESADETESGYVWGQKLNADRYPVFDVEGKRQVYQTTGCVTYSNQKDDEGREKEHAELENGICPDCGKLVKQTAQSVSYLDETGVEQSEKDVKILTGKDVQWKGTDAAPAWYVVRGNLSIKKRITVSGEVHLILADGCSLQADRGIHVATGNALTIHAQSNGKTAGTVTAAGQDRYAGIGSGSYEDGGTITIQGGNVTASGGDGAGIGSGECGAGGTITIQGGNVTALSQSGAGIGSGTSRDGGEVTIQGGNVTASSQYGAGIGGGDYGAGGNVTIHGGCVTALSRSGAGIGGGNDDAGGKIKITGGTVNASGEYGAGIGGGWEGAGGDITITGGMVNASGEYGAGIGNGFGLWRDDGGSFQTQTAGESASKGEAVIFASSITNTGGRDSWSGLIVYDGEGGFFGGMTEAEITEAAIIPANGSLTIEKDEKLTIRYTGTLTNNGKLVVKKGGSLINNGTLTNNGTLEIESEGVFDNRGLLQQKGNITDEKGEAAGENISGTVKKCLTLAKITTETKGYDRTNRVKVTDVTFSGMDEGDEVEAQDVELSAILSSYEPGTYDAEKIKSLEGSVTLKAEDAKKYYVDTTWNGNILVNDRKGVTITKNTEKITRAAAVRNYLCTRSYSEEINLSELYEYTWGKPEKSTVTLLDEEGHDIQEQEKWDAEVSYDYDYILSYATKACAAGKRKLIVDVETKYYSDIEFIVDMTFISSYGVQIKEGSEVLTDPEGITYGQSLSELAFQDTVFTDESGNVVPGTLAWKNPSYVPKVSETTAEWVFTPLNDAFASLEGKAGITVHKQKTQIAKNPKVELTYGQKLSDAVLTGGSAVNEKGETIPGSFEWKEPDQIPTAVESGKTKYKLVFVPEEAENYSECETELTVTVNKAAQAPAMPETEMTVPYTTKTVEEVSLPENWKWQTDGDDQSSSLEVNVPFKAVAEYVGQDKGNYETELVNVTITRKCTHESTEMRNAKPAGCTQDGYSGDDYCTFCETEVESGKTLEAYGHSYDTPQYTWGIGVDGKVNCTAVKTCTREGCNEEEADHCVTETVTAEVQDTKAATCTEKGTRTYTASFTKEGFSEAETREESIAATGHELTAVEAKEATATEPGNKPYFECEHCGKYFEDSEGKAEITDKDSVVIPAKGTTPEPAETSEPEPTLPGVTGAPEPTTVAPTNVPNPTIPSVTGAPEPTTVAPTSVPQPTIPSGTGAPEPTIVAPTSVPNPTIPSVTEAPEPTIVAPTSAPQPTTSAPASTDVPGTTTEPQPPAPAASSAPKNTAEAKTAIPDTVTINGVQKVVTSIKKNAYKNNKKLTEVRIGRKVTSIGDNAFAGCRNLKLVELDEKLTKIGKNAFKNCNKLKTITIRSTKLTKKSLNKDAFKGVSTNTVIKVPEKKRSDYEKLFRQKGLSKKVQIKGYR